MRRSFIENSVSPTVSEVTETASCACATELRPKMAASS